MDATRQFSIDLAIKSPHDGRERLVRYVYQPPIFQRTALLKLEEHTNWVTSVAFSPDGKVLASASRDSTVRLWDTATGAVIRKLEGHTDKVQSVAFSPDGKVLASGSWDLTVRLWDTAMGATRWTFDGHVDTTLQIITSVTFSPDGNIVAFASVDTTVQLGDTATGTVLQKLKGHRNWVTAVAFSPDGKLVASASCDKTARLWDTVTGAALWVLEGHTDNVESVAFSPNSNIVASASLDQTVRFWDTATGASVRKLEGHGVGLSSVAFSSDGKMMASGLLDGTIWLWDASPTGTVLQKLVAHTYPVTSVAFSPDDMVLASASADMTVRLWPKKMTLLPLDHEDALRVANEAVALLSGTPEGVMDALDINSEEIVPIFRDASLDENTDNTQDRATGIIGTIRRMRRRPEPRRRRTASDTMSDCETCRAIWSRLGDLNATHEVVIGSYKDAISSGCPTHTPLVKKFREVCLEDPNLLRDMGISKRVKGKSTVELIQSVSSGGMYWKLRLVKRDSIPGHVGTGRILDPNWADLDLVKRWKYRCVSLHSTKCNSSMRLGRTRPAWLVDIRNKCLVPGHDGGPFVALSYRLGELPWLKVNTEMLGILKKPKGLNRPEISARLPPIVRDAMYLTSIMGERYLWTDILCIVHGNHADTTAELNLMGAIYSTALVTIIAGDGDAKDGLAGLRGVSGSRRLNQHVIPFGVEKIVIQDYSIQGDSRIGETLKYYQRGWTFQEEMMSTRRLIFYCKELHWQCQCSIWHEGMALGSEDDKIQVGEDINEGLRVILAGFPDIGMFEMLVASYNRRIFRFSEDAHPAISGLLSVLSRSFPGGFLYGLPEMFFDQALAWHPSDNLKRRVPRGSGSQFSHSALPSWSWIGWQGAVMGSDFGPRLKEDWSLLIQETYPITVWYASNSPSGSPKRRIRSSWFENRDRLKKGVTEHLPPGWTRHDVSEDYLKLAKRSYLRHYVDKPGPSYQVFRHANMPDLDWYYPFPVSDITETTPPFIPEQSPYILCDTKMASLQARKQERSSTKLDLHNESGKLIGELRLHNEEQQQELFSQQQATRSVDLVAICLLRSYHNQNQAFFKKGKPIELQYVVLWVEWKGDVAYRLARGEIEKDEWEKLELKEIALVLG